MCDYSFKLTCVKLELIKLQILTCVKLQFNLTLCEPIYVDLLNLSFYKFEFKLIYEPSSNI